MRRTIPNKTLFPPSTAISSGSMSSSSVATSGGTTGHESQPSEINDLNASVAKLVAENAIVIVATRGCCMCLVVKRLLQGLGVNPTLFEVNEADEAALLEELSRIEGGPRKLPAVYIGGKLLGGVEKVMETHIKGELVPMLRQAGALWL